MTVPQGVSLLLHRRVLEPALDHRDRRAGGGRDLAQEGAALAVGLDQGDPAFAVQDREHHAGKARAAADIDGLPRRVRREQGGELRRIEEVAGPERRQRGGGDQVRAPLSLAQKVFVDVEPRACFT